MNGENAIQQEAVATIMEKPQDELVKNTNSLVEYGGFDCFVTTIDDTENLNPAKKARRTIFLKEANNAKYRKQLKKRLGYWLDLLSGDKDILQMIEVCEEKSTKAQELFNKNLAVGLEKTADLERAYRTVNSFFVNTGEDKVRNINFMNATMEQITNLDKPGFINKVKKELKHCYDRLGLKRNYSLLVLPGYLGRNSILNHWAEIANNYKVMLLTDFLHLDSSEDVVDLFMKAELTSADAYKANVMMTCNWLVGRAGYPDLGINEALYIPPSAALAGKIYTSKGTMAQVQAGNKFGKMKGVDHVAIELQKSEIEELEHLGLIPMVKDWGNVMAYSGKTLFTGGNLGLKSYSIVRTFDWVTKVLLDFLNRTAFENYNRGLQVRLKEEISTFLNSIQGNGKLIEDFEILELEQQNNKKDTINLKVHLTPFHAAKNFMLSLSGTKGKNASDWGSDVK